MDNRRQVEALRAANRGMARAVCQGAKTAKRYAALGAGMEVDAQGYGREPTAMVRGVLSCLFVCLVLTRITATDEVKLNVLSSSPPASHPPLDTVTPSANCHDKESVPPFTQSTLKDSWTIIPNCLCAKKQNHPPLFIRTLSVSSATP